MSSLIDDLVELIADSGLVLMGKVVVLGTTFVGHTLLVRNLEPSTFGTLSLALTIISVTAGFAAVGMGQATARFISASDLGEASEYVVISLSVVLILGPIFAILLYFANGYIGFYFGDNNLGYFIQLFSVLIILRLITTVVQGVIRGFKLTKIKVLHFDIIPNVISIPILYYFIIRGNTIMGAAIYYFLIPIIKLILTTIKLHQFSKWSFNPMLPNYGKATSVFSFSWPLAFESLVVVFLGSIDILMLGRLSTSEAVGQYRSIQPVAETVILFLQVLTFIYLPIATEYFEKSDLESLDIIYKAATRWIAHLTFPLFLFYLLFGEDFIRVVFGSEYVIAYVALAILSVGMYSRVIVGPNGMTIQAINRTKEDLLASFAGLITNIICNYILIPIYGLAGAATATMVGYFIYNTVELLIIHVYADVSPLHLDLFLPIVPTTLFWICIIYLFPPSAESIVTLVLIGLFISITHILSLLGTTGLTKNDKKLLKSVREKM